MPDPKNPTNQNEGGVQTLEEIEQAGLEAIAAANDKEDGAQPGAPATEQEVLAAAAAAAGGDGKTGADGEKVVYTEEFDLGNGKKVTFEAETLEGLREKIIAGYRDLAAGKQPEGTAAATAAVAAPGTGDGTAKPAVAVQPQKKGRKLSDDEEFAIEQEFKTGKPLKAFRQWLETEFGITPEELSESVQTSKAVQRLERETVAVKEFQKKHPEYPPMTPTSIDLVRRYLDTNSQEATVETLEAAYTHLGNLLVPVKPAGDGAGGDGKTGAGAGGDGKTGGEAGGGAKTVKKPAGSALFGKQGAGSKPPVDPNKPKALSQAEKEKIAKDQGSDALLAKLQEEFEAGLMA